MRRHLRQLARPSKAVLAALATLASGWCTVACASAQVSAGGRFDLTGPRIDVHVQRGEKSLPIAMVPNLEAGDKLTIHADLPETQSVKLILVVAFLRGTTNPPTDNWFTKANTWDKKVRTEGITVTVPKDAQQALMFLAPETGGDYGTLKSAVTGRPGVFVRAAQDLNEASFEQARIERYLQAIRRVPPGSSAELLDHSRKMAATLNLKPNEDCFKKEPDQQLSCLRQTGTQVLLDDGHGQTLASMITTGDSANLIGAVAGTPMGVGAYSAYVGTVIDLVRLMSGLHTAQFQYIPAIAFPEGETLNLRLNTPPSFHNPKSVIVVALPTIHSSVPPPLRLQDPDHVSCLLQPAMVLPLEGAPLVFATGFAHDLTLHLNGGTLNGATDLPLTPDAFEGGLVLTNPPERKQLTVPAEAQTATGPGRQVPAGPDVSAKNEGPVQITGTLRGSWGFDSFEGVTVPLQRRPGSNWTAAPQGTLIAGKPNQLLLAADGTACTSRVALLSNDKEIALNWKPVADGKARKQGELDVKLPLEKASPGTLQVQVRQFGTPAVETVAVKAYADLTHLEALHIHAGDTFGVLSGSGLGEVKAVKLAGVQYHPLPDQSTGTSELKLAGTDDAKAAGGKPAVFSVGQAGTAEVLLADGRTQTVPYTVDPARPAVDILNTTVQAESTGIPLVGSGTQDLPLNARITIALRSQFPARFPRTEKIEIALVDGSLHTALTFANGSLVLQDAKTALAFLSPSKVFGQSAFGPMQLRAVADDGTAGDWVPLGTLVRTPVISSVTCPHGTTKASDGTSQACSISGNNLFLVDSVSADSGFQSSSTVPLGFAGDTLPAPKPADNHTLYLKLRDDPNAIMTLTVPAPPAAAASRARGSVELPASPAAPASNSSSTTP